jgi:hypothetical protein
MGKLLGPCTVVVPSGNYRDERTEKAATGLARIPPIGARVHNFPSNECWRDANGSFSAFSTNQRTTPRGRLESVDRMPSPAGASRPED